MRYPRRLESLLMLGQLAEILFIGLKLRDSTQRDSLIVQSITSVLILDMFHLVLEEGYVQAYRLLCLTLSCHWHICSTILTGSSRRELRQRI